MAMDKMLKPVLVFGMLFVVLSIALGFGALVTDDLASTENTNITVNNVKTNTSAAADGVLNLGGNFINTVSVTNATPTVLGTGNYTLQLGQWPSTTPSITFASDLSAEWDGQMVNVSYNYINVSRTDAYSVFSNGTKTVSNISKYIPTLATVAIAAIIILFLLGAFTFGRRI